jgi:hypothetical protein
MLRLVPAMSASSWHLFSTHKAHEDVRHSSTSLLTSVRHEDVDGDTGKQSCLEQAQNHSDTDELSIVLGKGRRDSNGSPHEAGRRYWASAMFQLLSMLSTHA